MDVEIFGTGKHFRNIFEYSGAENFRYWCSFEYWFCEYWFGNNNRPLFNWYLAPPLAAPRPLAHYDAFVQQRRCSSATHNGFASSFFKNNTSAPVPTDRSYTDKNRDIEFNGVRIWFSFTTLAQTVQIKRGVSINTWSQTTSLQKSE